MNQSEIKEVINSLERIPINIWDDFYDDENIPNGEKQETYIYVEGTDLPHEKQKACLETLLKYITNNLELDGVKMWMFFYISKYKYPNLVGTEMEWCLFDRWEIRVENLTHERLYQLIEEIKEANISVDGIPFDIYSES